MPLENVNGCNARRDTVTGRKWCISNWGSAREIQRTAVQIVEALGLSHEAVNHVHLIYPGLGPAFLCDRSLNVVP